jgi:hypothetical protein
LTPELTPVQRRNRLGLDRGLVAAAIMVGVIGVLMIKPWATGDPGFGPNASPSGSMNAGTGRAAPSAPAQVAQAHAPRQTVSLSQLRDWVAAAGLASSDNWPALTRAAVFGTTFDLAGAPYRETVPSTEQLGANCVGGALLGEGYDTVAVLFDDMGRDAGVTSIRVDRLFDSGPALSMPVIPIENAVDGVVLTTALGLPWPPGHYAMDVATTSGSSLVLPFCIGRMTRLVDYSLIAYVPTSADGAAARLALLAQIARP